MRIDRHGSRGTKLLLLLATAALGVRPAWAGETVAYAYDARGRLITVTRTGTVNDGVSTGYSYDRADNRTLRTTSGAAQAAVPDASFELPELGTGFSYTPSATGVTFTGGAGIAGNGSAWSFASAPDGDQTAFIQGTSGGNGSISQSVSGLVVGATYRVTFRLAQRPNYAANPITVAVGGTSLGTFTPSSTAFAGFTSAAFTATATTATLSFTGQVTASDSASALDLVTVERQPEVADFSFEEPEIGSGYTQNPSVTGASFSGRAFVAGNDSAWSFAAAPGGDQVGVIQTYSGAIGTISQTVTGLIPGRSYRVTFMLAARPTYGGGIPLILSVDGAGMGTFTPSSTSFASFASTSFTATAGTATISFSGSLAYADGATAIDLVTVGPP